MRTSGVSLNRGECTEWLNDHGEIAIDILKETVAPYDLEKEAIDVDEDDFNDLGFGLAKGFHKKKSGMPTMRSFKKFML